MELQESRVFNLSFTHEEANLLKEYLSDVDDNEYSLPAVVQAAQNLMTLLCDAHL